MKKYDCIMFDLDGTLLPMELDEFTRLYFGALSACMRPYGYEAEPFIAGIWSGVKAMVANDGSCTNMERFWQKFSEKVGSGILEHRDIVDGFYVGDFNLARPATRPNPDAPRLVQLARERAGRVILATNPIFPANGVNTRLSWIGLSLSDFDYVTTYENSHYCKPNPMYYTELVSVMKLDPARCLMVGNDIAEDGAARKAGFDVHLVTDCLLGDPAQLSDFPHSTFSELLSLI